MLPEPNPSLPAKPKEELTPAGLVTLWKKSGEFDALRRRLVAEFLASGDREQLATDLDAILPRVLESAVPPLSRIPRKDRPSHVLETLDTDPLAPTRERVRARLTTQRDHASVGLGRTIERQLRNCRRKHYGPTASEPLHDEPDALEQEEPSPVHAATSTANETATTGEPRPGPPVNGTAPDPPPAPASGPLAGLAESSSETSSRDKIGGEQQGIDVKPIVAAEGGPLSTRGDPSQVVVKPESL
ncbi:hypothetical protein JCM11491_001614 [Sporobolomyces phaffii]